MGALRTIPASRAGPGDGSVAATRVAPPQSSSPTRGGAAMTFDHPLLLLLVLLPVAWAAWEWRFSSRRTALLLKAGAFAAIATALAQPRLTVYQTKVAVAV